jgi:bacterioferritin-associated ferredoxin
MINQIADKDLRRAARQMVARVREIAPEITAAHAEQIVAEFIEASLEARHLERLEQAPE